MSKLFRTSVLALAVSVAAAAGTGEAMSAGDSGEHVFPIWPGAGARYYYQSLPNGTRANVVEIDTAKKLWQFKVVLAGKTSPTSEIAEKNGASVGVNAGYFNMTDGVSASYITADGKQVADPHVNRALVENPKLKPHLEKIFARSEVRVLQDAKGNQTIAIVPHNSPVPENLKLLQAVQAGPQLLPVLTARPEAFLRIDPDGKEADSIGVLRPAARTAFGVAPDGRAFMVAIAGQGQNPESSGMTLEELASFMRSLGCVSAINFDGGASTTMFIRTGQAKAPAAKNSSLPLGKVVCGKQPETLVKSVFLLVPVKRP